MTEQEEDYILSHTGPVPQELKQLYRDTHLRRLYPRMCCEHLQGRLLTMLCHMIQPRRVLELGTFSGYATLCFAEGLAPGGQVHTVEIDDEAAPGLRRTFDASPYGHRVTLHVGDALAVVPQISAEPWDLVYIDANKRQYPEYYAMVKPLVRPGGYILADNTLWSDAVLDPSKHDPQTLGVRRFNDLVGADPEVEKLILPLYDGLTIIRKP